MPDKFPKQDRKTTLSSSTPPADPSQKALFALVKEAIAAVPEVKWALGVVGVIATVALILGLKISPLAAIFGFTTMLILMVLLLIFAHAARNYAREGGAAGKVLIWFALILFMILALCMLGSATINAPWHFRDWIERELGTPNVGPPPPPESSITGTVSDESGKPLEGVTAKIFGKRAAQTDSNGIFRLNADAPVLIEFSKPGYESQIHNIYPGGNPHLTLRKAR